VIDHDSLPWAIVALVGGCSSWHFAYIGAFVGNIVEAIKMKEGAFTTVRKELWWVEVHLAFPGMLGYWLITANSTWDWVTLAINFWVWTDWYRHHDHDDRWKKRRKKALAKVKQVAGKLVVVPIPVPAGA
jgi:hypothetical protein